MVESKSILSNWINILSILIGLIIISSTCLLIFWNESHTAHYETLQLHQDSEHVAHLSYSTKSFSSKLLHHTSEKKHKTASWRTISCLLMILGVLIIFKSIIELKDMLPVFGNIINLGMGLISILFGFMIWTTVTLIAWIIVKSLFIPFIILLIAFILYSLRKKILDLQIR